MNTFSEKLKKLREEKKLTQGDLAKVLSTDINKVSPQNVSYWEKGRQPSFEMLINIAKYFNVTTDYLIGISDFKTVEDEYIFKKNNELLEFDYSKLDPVVKKYFLYFVKKFSIISSFLIDYDNTFSKSTFFNLCNAMLNLSQFFNEAVKKIIETKALSINKYSIEKDPEFFTLNEAMINNFINIVIPENERYKLNKVLDKFEDSVKFSIFQKTYSELFNGLNDELKKNIEK